MIQDRLNELVKALGLNVNSLSARVGVKQPTLQGNVSGKALPSYETLDKILTSLPQVSAEWLMRGNGDMFLDPEKQAELERKRAAQVAAGNIGDVVQVGSQQKLKVGHQAGGGEAAPGVAAELALCRQENELLKQALAGKDELIRGKDELITAKNDLIEALRGR